jgi:signal transduction histidine kinase
MSKESVSSPTKSPPFRGYRQFMEVLFHPPLLKRLREAHWVAIDCAAAVLIGVIDAAGFNIVGALSGVPKWLAVVLALCAVVPAAARRLWPAIVLIVLAAASAVTASFSTAPALPLAVAFAAYLVALRLSTRRALQLLAVSLLLPAGGLLAFGLVRHGPAGVGGLGSAAGQFGEGAALIIAAWLIGFAVRQQRAYVAAQQEDARRRARAELAEMRRATSKERLQIARELHDVVSHSMSLIAVQAGVANYVTGEHPEEAGRALSSIEQISRNALSEMRALLEVLRADRTGPADVEDGLDPLPGLADLEGLTVRTAAAGVRVEIDVRGQPSALSRGVDLSAYRVLQEALTNVVKHAHCESCRVVVAYEGDAVALEVSDEGVGVRVSPSRTVTKAHGIDGMRERVAMYGGEFQAGPLPDRGFRVVARFPTSKVTT